MTFEAADLSLMLLVGLIVTSVPILALRRPAPRARRH